MRHWNDPMFLVRSDTAWQAGLRRSQSWYRANYLHVEAGLDPSGEPRGNFIPADAPAGLNFLSPEISYFVDEWLAHLRQPDSLVHQDRLRRNMLSSMPLAFNLFAPLRNDLAMASEVFRRLTLGRVGRVTGINWEYSPGRRDPRFTNDRTAFDVYVTFEAPSGEPGFIGIEVKYHEAMRDDRAAPSRRYVAIAKAMRCFHTAKLTPLQAPPLGQIWRNHLLAGSLLKHGGFRDGISAIVFPSANEACRKAVKMYREHLSEPTSFAAWELEQVASTIRQAEPSTWIDSLHTRYLTIPETL